MVRRCVPAWQATRTSRAAAAIGKRTVRIGGGRWGRSRRDILRSFSSVGWLHASADNLRSPDLLVSLRRSHANPAPLLPSVGLRGCFPSPALLVRSEERRVGQERV